jgi:hypothetical protein
VGLEQSDPNTGKLRAGGVNGVHTLKPVQIGADVGVGDGEQLAGDDALAGHPARVRA